MNGPVGGAPMCSIRKTIYQREALTATVKISFLLTSPQNKLDSNDQALSYPQQRGEVAQIVQWQDYRYKRSDEQRDWRQS